MYKLKLYFLCDNSSVYIKVLGQDQTMIVNTYIFTELATSGSLLCESLGGR